MKDCFLLAPIGATGSEVRKRSDTLLNHVIRPAAEETGYNVIRADEISVPGSITSQIIRLTIDSPLVIADLSGRNPNVLYELGVRHSTGKPVIQITTEAEDLPFDIAAIRTIIVDVGSVESVFRARKILAEAISHLEANPASVDTPVGAVLDIQRLEAERAHERPQPPPGPTDSVLSTVVNVLGDLESRMKGLEHRIDRSLTSSQLEFEYSRRIFIVHGHDGELKSDLARLLVALDFEPVILHEQPDRGQTIFSKLNGELADVGFAFILLTPDDRGSVAKDEVLKPRARQNVVFEHGLFTGFMKPERVCAIRRGDVEIPSDLHGVLYKTIPEGEKLRSIALEIANELRAAGYILDANKLLTL